MPAYRPAIERFHDLFEIDPVTQCWLWKGVLSTNGYGRFRSEGGRPKMAHRAAYEMLVGPIPCGLVLDHLCRVRNCVNPKHLEPVTHSENNRRCDQGMRGRHGNHSRGQSHYLWKSGRRF